MVTPTPALLRNVPALWNGATAPSYTLRLCSQRMSHNPPGWFQTAPRTFSPSLAMPTEPPCQQTVPSLVSTPITNMPLPCTLSTPLVNTVNTPLAPSSAPDQLTDPPPNTVRVPFTITLLSVRLP